MTSQWHETINWNKKTILLSKVRSTELKSQSLKGSAEVLKNKTFSLWNPSSLTTKFNIRSTEDWKCTTEFFRTEVTKAHPNVKNTKVDKQVCSLESQLIDDRSLTTVN